MHSHHHPPTEPAMRWEGVLRWALVITLALVAVEFAAGYWGGSIALISDAVHNLTDIPSMALSWVALLWAAKSPTSEKTYGYHRSGILAAFANGILLALFALVIGYESIERLLDPREVHEALMLWVAVGALGVNGGISLALLRGRHDLNLRSVLVHNLGDALSNVGLIVGALVIAATGAMWVDPLLGLAIAALVLWSSYGILTESAHVLLEGLPRGMQLDEVARSILRVEGVREVHDIHVWTIGTNLHALSCHVRLPDMHMDESERILRRIHEVLADEFHITHTTVQVERAGLPAESDYVLPRPYTPAGSEKNRE